MLNVRVGYLEWTAVKQPGSTGETTNTVQAQFVTRNYDVFAGLDVDKKSMAVSFTDQQQLKQALRLPYSAELLLSYLRKLVAIRKEKEKK
jgi:hypothetical protein